MEKLIGLSLFANIGVAEAYLKDIGVTIAVANELLENRAKFYQEVYPETEMICGDITQKEIYNQIISKSKEKNVNFVIATPPCQGMSTAGKQHPNDERNYLITYALNVINELNPKFILLENVPQQLRTTILVNGKKVLIPDYIVESLKEKYVINADIVNSVDYGVPQMRQRSMFLMVRRDLKIKWNFISSNEKSKPITLFESIGDLPSLDPQIQGFSLKEQLEYFPDYETKRNNGLKISKWHYPPIHKLRHVEVMKYTPEGCSALENTFYYPKNSSGTKVKGYKNTYKRQWWNRPAYTVTTYNGAICSQDNVHPGRYIGIDTNGEKLYSDARVLSIYELMIVMSIPRDWPIPSWASDSLIRHSLGEGIPPLIIKKLFENLLKELSQDDEN
ncbi:DNA cytosine methyltransferase [Acholeplasma equifetale]|uniref:DNA cytosine methyltransferase n=1 Tax=Acholeplasma equifetale TaxID=264634 RepID=UPI000556B9E3|nr:DNA cytosine methyltransferase [Acholeplasma equifetale]